MKIKLNDTKAEFLKVRQCDIHGHKITTEGILLNENKVKAISAMPTPTDVNGARRFCGMVQYLARFIPDLSNELELIRSLTRTGNEWNWTGLHVKSRSRK